MNNSFLNDISAVLAKRYRLIFGVLVVFIFSSFAVNAATIQFQVTDCGASNVADFNTSILQSAIKSGTKFARQH